MLARKILNTSIFLRARPCFARAVSQQSVPQPEISKQFIPPFDDNIRKARKKLEAPSTMMNVTAFSTAEVYNLDSISSDIQNLNLYKEISFSEEVEDAIHLGITNKDEGSNNSVYIFKKGSVVFWNIKNEEQDKILSILKRHSTLPYDEALSREENEILDYTTIEGETKFTKGKIFLKSTCSSDLEKYAFSNGMVVSVKLAIWENLLQDFFEKIENIESGNSKTIFKSINQLRAIRRRITFHSEFLEDPDFYWEQEKLAKLYHKTVNYLEIAKRTKVLNSKMDECFSQLGYLENELKDQHHVRLEKIIIFLIMIEVVQGVLHFYI